MAEVWKQVSDFEGLYEVSNEGRIRKVRFINNHVDKEKVFLVTPQDNGRGYLKVSLYKNGQQTQRLVHRVVADAFLDRDPNRDFVNHIDGNKRNNRADNLEWCTRSENMLHAYKSGLLVPAAKGRFGKDSRKAKKVEMLDDSGNVLMTFGSMIDGARFFGKSCCGEISSCCNGHRKKAHGYRWRIA